eukprot:TRINITY_DN3562_c0_g1_i2.p1 TRINITY_DN3562_c0_g1~~TRINITY_DN3562_c0_g1_i2.p1  ORF type:complete len:486 (-),score=40.49 TRINITY_DN3562_c0_g1_i2:176-1633(-)
MGARSNRHRRRMARGRGSLAYSGYSVKIQRNEGKVEYQRQQLVIVRNHVTGEELLSFTLAATASVQEAVEEYLAHLMPFTLIYGTACGAEVLHDTMSEQLEVGLVRLLRPLKFERVCKLGIFDAGYHCHDTYLDSIRCQEVDRFCIAWQRSFHGDDFDKYTEALRSAFREKRPCELEKKPYCSEIATLDVTKRLQSNSSGNHSAHVRRAHVRRAHEGRTRVRLLGIDANDVMYILEQRQDEGNQATFIRQRGASPDPSSWEIVYDAGTYLSVSDCYFVDDSLYLLGQTLVELVVSGMGTLQEKRRMSQDVPKSTEAGWRSMKTRFLGLDTTREALWIATSSGVYAVSLDTLDARECLLWRNLKAASPHLEDEDGHLHDQVLFDPATRDIYFFWDLSLRSFREDRAGLESRSATCEVYRLSPSEQDPDNYRDVHYADIPGNLVCNVNFGIDGFSDSFCIGQVHFSPGSRRLFVLDACDTLWSLDLQ